MRSPILAPEFTSNIQHIPGQDDVVFDSLSRVAEVKIHATVDLPAIVEALKDDAVFQSLKTNSKYTFRELPTFVSTSSIVCET